MLQALTLDAPRLSIAEPRWLFAQTCNLLSGAGLVVYRSTWLPTSDELYAPVRDLLRKSRVEILINEVIEDPMMMFAQGVWTLYAFVSAPRPVRMPWTTWPPEAVHPSFEMEEMVKRGVKFAHALAHV